MVEELIDKSELQSYVEQDGLMNHLIYTKLNTPNLETQLDQEISMLNDQNESL